MNKKLGGPVTGPGMCRQDPSILPSRAHLPFQKWGWHIPKSNISWLPKGVQRQVREKWYHLFENYADSFWKDNIARNESMGKNRHENL